MRAEPMSMTGACAPGGTPAGGHAEMPAISLRGVSRRFGTLLAVDGVDLDVRRGEVFGLIGHNGAGKSTLFKMMLGLLPASSGSIRVAGADVSGRDARAVRRQVGYLPENVVLWDNLTGLETLRFFARVKAVPVDTCPALLARVGLEAAMRRPVREYSKGMRQRLGFAQALLGQPQVLFLDEPTTGLDPHAIRQFWDMLGALRTEGVTMVLSSHILAELQNRVDRVAVLAAGRVQALGSIDALRAQRDLPLNVVLRLDAPDAAVAAAMIADSGVLDAASLSGMRQTTDGLALQCPRASKVALLQAVAPLGARLHDIHVIEPSLEDLFFGVTEAGSR